MEISHLLDISTHHVSNQTAAWLTDNSYSGEGPETQEHAPLTIGNLPCGWFIYVPTEDAIAQRNIPEDLKAVLKYAVSRQIAYVLLDRDADLIEELPEFNW